MQPLPHDYLQLIHDFQTRQQENEVAGLTALKRLLPIAQRCSRRACPCCAWTTPRNRKCMSTSKTAMRSGRT